jgi:GT2 family glycosyltransferase
MSINTLPKVMIAVPNLGTVHVKLMTLLMRWMSDNQGAWQSLAVLAPNGMVPHDNARNFCVMEFLRTDNDYLFFIDSDVIPPYDALKKLLEAQKDAISGCYPSVRFDSIAGLDKIIYNVFRHTVNEKGTRSFVNVTGQGVEEIESAGAGCLLIKREVLEKMGADWFRFQYAPEGTVIYGEDIDFCMKLPKHGYKLYGHFDVICKHWKNIQL